jgi:hypothetical protein
MDEESGILRESYACTRISVENRDYHQLSHFEIGGDKRISRSILSGRIAAREGIEAISQPNDAIHEDTQI